MNIECVYIIYGHMIESMDDFTWVEEVFIDKEQADVCCKYLNDINNSKINFHVIEHKICTYDYIGMLKDKKEYEKKLIEEQEIRRMKWEA